MSHVTVRSRSALDRDHHGANVGKLRPQAALIIIAAKSKDGCLLTAIPYPSNVDRTDKTVISRTPAEPSEILSLLLRSDSTWTLVSHTRALGMALVNRLQSFVRHLHLRLTTTVLVVLIYVAIGGLFLYTDQLSSVPSKGSQQLAGLDLSLARQDLENVRIILRLSARNSDTL